MKVNKPYLSFVRRLPCLVCYREFWKWYLGQPREVRDELFGGMLETLSDHAGRIQTSPTEAAHLGLSTTRRGLKQKFPDTEAGPLCRGHHRELGDSHHVIGAAFFEHHRIPRDEIISELQRIFAAGVAKE